MGRRAYVLGAMVLLGPSCSPGPVSYPAVGLPAPATDDADAGTPEAQPALPETCVVALRLNVTESSPLEWRVEVVAENRRAEPIAFELPERCPNGLVDFTGLGEGYDYYGTCAAGACFRPNSAVTITLGPSERRSLAQTTLYLAGQAPCRKPLSAGSYRLSAVPPRSKVEICGETAPIDVPPSTPIVLTPSPAPERPAPAPSPVGPATPPVPKLASGAECSTMADCVLSCPDAPGCCGFPCGCRNAIPRSKQAAFEAGYAKSCQKAPCPAMGCAYEPAVGATCKNGRCVAVSSPSEF